VCGRMSSVCFVCQTIHYNVLAVLINTTLVADVKMAVMDTYRKINVHVCVMGVSGQVINDCQGSPDAGRPAGASPGPRAAASLAGYRRARTSASAGGRWRRAGPVPRASV